MRPLTAAFAALVGVCMAAPVGRAQDQPSLLDWSQTTARGILDLCRKDGPDANQLIEHAEIWGWPHFMAYQETPDGYTREAGGQSRRSYKLGDETASVDLTVQSGFVASETEARVAYFRCNIAADQPIEADLESYFTALYGPPTVKSEAATTWLLGASASAAPDDDDAALKPVAAQGVGAEGERIELSRMLGRDRAKLTIFRNVLAR